MNGLDHSVAYNGQVLLILTFHELTLKKGTFRDLESAVPSSLPFSA